MTPSKLVKGLKRTSLVRSVWILQVNKGGKEDQGNKNKSR